MAWMRSFRANSFASMTGAGRRSVTGLDLTRPLSGPWQPSGPADRPSFARRDRLDDREQALRQARDVVVLGQVGLASRPHLPALLRAEGEEALDRVGNRCRVSRRHREARAGRAPRVVGGAAVI